MNDKEKKELEKLIQENQTVDQTQSIRERKHSSLIRLEVLKLYKIKYESNIGSEKDLRDTLKNQCEFLFKNYRELYEILITKDMNISFLMKLIELLENIENGNLSQHEGSFALGKLLKEIYIDPKINKTIEKEENDHVKISWSEYKRINK
jgi:signal recognition particle GTPase